MRLAKRQEVNYDYDHVNNIIILSDCDQDQPVSIYSYSPTLRYDVVIKIIQLQWNNIRIDFSAPIITLVCENRETKTKYLVCGVNIAIKCKNTKSPVRIIDQD